MPPKARKTSAGLKSIAALTDSEQEQQSDNEDAPSNFKRQRIDNDDSSSNRVPSVFNDVDDLDAYKEAEILRNRASLLVMATTQLDGPEMIIDTRQLSQLPEFYPDLTETNFHTTTDSNSDTLSNSSETIPSSTSNTDMPHSTDPSFHTCTDVGEEVANKPSEEEEQQMIKLRDQADYRSRIYCCYPIMKNILQRLNKVDIFHFMIASKETYRAINPPYDHSLLDLVVNVFVTTATEERRIACQWCKQAGAECCYCKVWSHLNYYKMNAGRVHDWPWPFGSDEFTSSQRRSDPAKRLVHLCADCTGNLPKGSSDGRCLCDTQTRRYICRYCSTKETKILQAQELPWYVWTPPKLDGYYFNEEIKKAVDLDDDAPPKPPYLNRKKVAVKNNDSDGPSNEETKAVPTPSNPDNAIKYCENLVSKGQICNKIIEPKSSGKRCVRCCTWCGLIALDDPLGMEDNWIAPPKVKPEKKAKNGEEVIIGRVKLWPRPMIHTKRDEHMTRTHSQVTYGGPTRRYGGRQS